MAYLNKTITSDTIKLTNEINQQVERYIANRKYSKNNEKYTKAKFCKEVGVSKSTSSNITHSELGQSITLDTALRLLRGCGLTLKISPLLMPKDFYNHKDIIMPKEYEERGE